MATERQTMAAARPAKAREPGRRERKKLASRQAILRAAREEFVRRGYKEASIADIMERADLGVGTFYNYFASKEEVLMQILAGLMGEVAAALEKAKTAGVPAGERLVFGCSHMARLLDENRFVLALFLSVGSGAPHGMGAEKPAAARPGSNPQGNATKETTATHGAGGAHPGAPAIKDVFLKIIEEAQQEGTLCQDVPSQLVAELVHACFQSAAFSHLPLTFRENFEQKFSLLRRGIEE